MSDILAVLLTLADAATAPCSAYADVNCDGTVDGFDAVLILRHVSELPSAIPGCPAVGTSSV